MMKKPLVFYLMVIGLLLFHGNIVYADDPFVSFQDAMKRAIEAYNGAVESYKTGEYGKVKDLASRAMKNIGEAEEVVNVLKEKMEQLSEQKKPEAKTFIEDLETKIGSLREKIVIVQTKAESYFKFKQMHIKEPLVRQQPIEGPYQSAPQGSSGSSKW
jgi:hypothetical protein